MIYTNDAIRERTTRKQKRDKIWKVALITFIIVFIAFICNILYQIFIQKNSKIGIFGYDISIVMTGNMQPSINIGDILIEKKAVQGEIAVGDVISFNMPNSKTNTTRRVAEIVNENDKVMYKTKGELNRTADPELVSIDMIDGKVIKHIAGFGVLISYIFSKTGLALLAFFSVMLYFIISNKKTRMVMREEARKLYNFPRYEQKEG